MRSFVSRRSSLIASLMLFAATALLPAALAQEESADVADVACPVLPLWDATWCWVGVTFTLVNWAYVFITCDVIGGPFCNLNVCDITNICTVVSPA